MSGCTHPFRSIPSGNPHISYYDATNGHLKYAEKTGSVWTTENVDTGLNVGLYTSLALDGTGNPRISYRNGGSGDLKYATAIPPLILNFTASSRNGTAPLNVQFSDTSTGGLPSCWNWSFGDGAWFNTSSAAERDPAHVYESPGTYNVTLIVQNLYHCRFPEQTGIYYRRRASGNNSTNTFHDTNSPGYAHTTSHICLILHRKRPPPLPSPPRLPPHLPHQQHRNPLLHSLLNLLHRQLRNPQFHLLHTLSTIAILDSGSDDPPDMPPVHRNPGSLGCQTGNCWRRFGKSDRVRVIGWDTELYRHCPTGYVSSRRPQSTTGAWFTSISMSRRPGCPVISGVHRI